ncbi:16S rRNA (uracil(1498)-N(3))-methyltransferase [Alcaligenaceae bacterium CGII-47]|nr:16S rRNA (uracil(1498)-N(3))-methyltransferase [Alcaligenaceae bacterium CGII-47]
MPAPRFYCPTPLAAHARIDLPKALAHHALRVLRLRPGTTITLFDGTGGEYTAQLQSDGKAAWADTAAFQPIERELPADLTLLQGMASGDKMDWIVEKAVEMGFTRVVPIAAQRSVLQLSGPRLEKRLQHWRHIVLSATEQCGRNQLMTVDAPASLAQALSTLSADVVLLCHPEDGRTLAQSLPGGTRHITLLVGPEGGWSPTEIAQARQSGAIPLVLGSRVLRTETAAIALAAAVCTQMGWYGP